MLFSGTDCPIICCTSANEVKCAVSVYVKCGDSVLEVGSERNDVSSHICRSVGSDGMVFLADKKRANDKWLGSEEESFADRVSVTELKSLGDWRKTLFDGDVHYDVIILGISHLVGLDLYMTQLVMAHEMLQCCARQPRVMIVKSKKLYSLSRRLIHSHKLFDGSSQVPSDIERSSEPAIVATVKVEEYRNTHTYLVKESDAILELGCHFGQTTKLLEKAGRFCIGVDIGSKIIRNAQRQHPEISFAVGDAWKTMALIQFRKELKGEDELGFDLVYVDVGGLSGSDGQLESLSLLEALGCALQPRAIVIKSLCMRDLASRLKFWPDLHDKITAKHVESYCAESIEMVS